MYSPTYGRLNTPPPVSQLRRPWSPAFESENRRPVRREASELSFEALDLADYSAALRRATDYPTAGPISIRDSGPYPPFAAETGSFREHTSASPISVSNHSRPPPSLVSSLASPSRSSHPDGPSTPSYRPVSLPRVSYHTPPATVDSQYRRDLPGSYPMSAVHSAASDVVGTFPEWSRTWYEKRDVQYAPLHTDVFPDVHNSDSRSYYSRPYPSSNSHANLLPWSGADDTNDLPVPSQMKEERFRMLEREFGGQYLASKVSKQKIGTIDEKGNMITAGPKKRGILRVLQVLLALGASIASFYSAIVSISFFHFSSVTKFLLSF